MHEALETRTNGVELLQDLFGVVAVLGGVVLEVQRIQYHYVWTEISRI